MKGKFSNALSLALILAMLVTAIGFADNVKNDVVAGGNDTIYAGGTTSVGYKIDQQPANQDGQASCNASDGTSANVTINVPDGVTVDTDPQTAGNQNTLTFTDCNTWKYASFTASVSGDYDTSVSVSDNNNSGGSYDTSRAAFTLHVLAPVVTNTPPTVVVTGVADGASYEFGSVPAAGCSVTDAEDGNSTFAATLSAITGPLDAYGLGSQTASCSFTDSGGLSATPASATYTIVDTTDPEVSCDSADGLWHAADVSIPCTASDNVALADDADVSFSLVTNVPAGTEDSNASTNSHDVYDVAGNFVTAGPVSGNMVDKKAPTNISFVGGSIADGGSYYFGFVPAGPSSCTADDGGSGIASCDVTGGGTTVGPHSYVATATDNVGNSDTATMNYTVLAWTFNGFFQPVDMGVNVWNTVKGGSTVPLKFEVFAGSTELTDTAIVSAFSKQVACGTAGTEDTIEVLATGGTSLRYDWTSGQFVYNWQTPKLPGKCYLVTMTTLDGSTLVAYFKLK